MKVVTGIIENVAFGPGLENGLMTMILRGNSTEYPILGTAKFEATISDRPGVAMTAKDAIAWMYTSEYPINATLHQDDHHEYGAVRQIEMYAIQQPKE